MTAERKKLSRLRRLARIREAGKSLLAGERAGRVRRVEQAKAASRRNRRFLDEALESSGMYADQALRLLDEDKRVEEEERDHLARLEEEVRQLHEKQSRLEERADRAEIHCDRRDQEGYLNEVLMQQLAMGVPGRRK